MSKAQNSLKNENEQYLNDIKKNAIHTRKVETNEKKFYNYYPYLKM